MPALYCYYADDFTGSTDVLEQLAGNGVDSVLFLTPPTPARLARFAHCRAIGLAGDARSRTPKWMSAHLPGAFAALGKLAPRIIHYKVCSTFDSAPHRGSIGRALEIGRDVFGTNTVPIVVGAPHLGRYLVFGQLFATANGEVRRLDRHPAAADHPATPMREADLRLHLARQTALPIGLVDLRAFEAGRVGQEFRAQAKAGAAAVFLDGCNEAMVEQSGQLLSDLSDGSQPLFAIGSSGLTAGLIAHWRSDGTLAEPPVSQAARVDSAADRILALSGSCSATTAQQILWAGRQGYALVELDAAALAGGDRTAAEAALQSALHHLRAGRDTILYTALGPPATPAHGEDLGAALGRLLLEVASETAVRRVVLCGGDTSSHAVQQLGLAALTFAGALVPGAPLCRAHSENGPLDGLELVLKGGQMGPEDFFAIARQGNSVASVR